MVPSCARASMSARTLIPRFRTSGACPVGRHRGDVLPVLAPDAEDLGDARDRLALFVEDRGLELRVDLPGRVGLLLELGEQRGRHFETRANPSATWLQEVDGRGLVPDDVF